MVHAVPVDAALLTQFESVPDPQVPESAVPTTGHAASASFAIVSEYVDPLPGVPLAAQS